jgi:outer membrane protein assembly factor BamE (lipoprotein component of BamABCDE complex)
MKLAARDKRTTPHWSARSAQLWVSAACVPALLLVGASCSRNDAASVSNPAKVATVVVGQSSRADVFAALGRPARTQQSSSGESWVYESKADAAGRRGVLQGVAAASGVVGAFVPYAGLVGSGLGLADTAVDGAPRAETTSLTVEFGPDGVVRECVYSSTAPPANVPGTGAVAPPDCQRPAHKGRS